jgi:hypothetical protein
LGYEYATLFVQGSLLGSPKLRDFNGIKAIERCRLKAKLQIHKGTEVSDIKGAIYSPEPGMGVLGSFLVDDDDDVV